MPTEVERLMSESERLRIRAALLELLGEPEVSDLPIAPQYKYVEEDDLDEIGDIEDEPADDEPPPETRRVRVTIQIPPEES